MATSLSRRVRTALFYALRTAFRLTPMPQGTRDRLRERFLDTKGHWVPEGPKGQAPMGELPRRPYVRSDERAIGYVPYEKGELPDPLPATLVAFYLPQFHTIPENDEWWGKGFTEWRNVTRALPQFEGHYQPKLPGDLGFYDLRNVEVMHEQARLAREYGISAFCFYFYWFGSKTLLETPLRNWLNDKTIDLKFCLCWANEKWTRTWDGRGDEILIDQKHSPEDDIAFIEYVAEYMRDPRYLRLHGRPILAVYRPGLLVDAGATVARWRAWCRNSGLGEIHIAYVQSFDCVAPESIGFDAAIAFPPNLGPLPSFADKLQLVNPAYNGQVFDWRRMWTSHFSLQKGSDFRLHAGVNPCWDNQARRPGGGRAFVHSSPRNYRDALIQACGQAITSGDSLVFVNAWNEWAEGAILEPDARYGFAYLQATRTALRLSSATDKRTKNLTPTHAIVHVWYPDVLKDVLARLARTGLNWHLLITTTADKSSEVEAILDAGSTGYRILIVENRGRDILPFLAAANQLIDEGVDVVLKIHTKRSLHRQDGDAWRTDLLEKLLDNENAARILNSFHTNARLGLVAPVGHTQPMSYYWGANKTSVQALSGRIGLNGKDLETETFVSGSMFWVRLESLRTLLDADLVGSDFDDERGQLDGTLAHAVERLFSVCVRDRGFLTRESADEPANRSDYPYATRG